ncbi:hypothetical protein LSH36_372g04065 [Paralvinella palmiformis]|uniref:Uncharacterized protein n=1 Tax=Paralvinella palmiformis TaxID=53620 RepID=A0AAD9JE12_9ANNE|nr:hypothetical protein LSH36_372g04065 [Paralvinella palmiformis]
MKLDNCISAIEVLYHRQMGGTKTQTSLVDIMTKLKNDTDGKRKAMEDKRFYNQDRCGLQLSVTRDQETSISKITASSTARETCITTL